MKRTESTLYNKVKNMEDKRKEMKSSLQRDPTESEMEYIVKDYEYLKVLEIDKEEEKAHGEVEIGAKISIWNNDLRKLRLEAGMKQSTLAEKCGMNSQKIGQIERFQIMPKKEEIEIISEVLGIDCRRIFPDWLSIFSEKWKRTEKTKLVKISSVSLDSKEVMSLTTGTDSLISDVDNKVKVSKLIETYKEMCAMKRTPSKIKTLDQRNGMITPKEQKIIEMRYGFGEHEGEGQKDFEIVGREFDVSRERIRQIEARVIEKIKNKLLKRYDKEDLMLGD